MCTLTLYDPYSILLLGYRARIESGEVGFAELASKESDCGSAKKGGDLGPFGPGQMQSKSTHSVH